MKKSKLIALLLAVVLTLTLAACGGGSKTPSDSGQKPSSSETEQKETNETTKGFDGEIVFGVVAPITGTNKMVGEYVVNGAELAAKHINEKGGILGKELKLVFEDEVDNLQASVNAMTKIMNYPEVVGFFGSTYSSYVIGASPIVLEKKIPMMAGGSSANIPKENNPYIWQVRMTDDQSGLLLAKAATENLKMKKPAILFITDSFGTGLKDQTIDALKTFGIEVPDSMLFGFTAEEKNFTPLLTQIQNSGADGLIAIGHQMPAALICQQVEAVGLDMPLLGSSSFASAVCRTNAGDSANGWYAVADWTPEVTTEEGKAFAQAFQEAYNMESDMPAVTAYDSIMVFAEACKIANTTTDKEAINEAFKQIKDFKGAMSTYTYAENHCFSTSQFLTVNKDGKATMIDTVKSR